MAINMSIGVYRPCQDVFSVSCVVYPIASQPGASSYSARGIFGTDDIEVMAEDGSFYSDQRTIFDIRTAEFAVVPQQKDRIDIPVDAQGEPQGMFEVTDSVVNGGGEMTLVIRKVDAPRPDRKPRGGYILTEEADE